MHLTRYFRNVFSVELESLTVSCQQTRDRWIICLKHKYGRPDHVDSAVRHQRMVTSPPARDREAVLLKVMSKPSLDSDGGWKKKKRFQIKTSGVQFALPVQISEIWSHTLGMKNYSGWGGDFWTNQELQIPALCSLLFFVAKQFRSNVCVCVGRGGIWICESVLIHCCCLKELFK